MEVRVPQMAKVPANKVDKIVCHRLNSAGDEEYLVKWKGLFHSFKQPYSWHITYELTHCLALLQDYVDLQSPPVAAPKRKQNGTAASEPGTPSSPPCQKYAVSGPNGRCIISEQVLLDAQSYNCAVVVRKGKIAIVTSPTSFAYQIDGSLLPTPKMVWHASQSRTTTAAHEIRLRVLASLTNSSPPINLLNTVDQTSLSLRFEFIEKSVLGPGVIQADPATLEGCRKCSPHMGNGIGCEYTAKCDCLEFAAVDVSRLTEEQKRKYRPDGDTQGFPKRFPYYSSGERARCLVPFYLDQRYVIFECNDKCKCGDRCKSRVVQRGRSVPLTVFRTRGRGWGLKTPTALLKGQFIDTYRGEILTNADATERERQSGESEPSYMYSLDKFSEYVSEEDVYVVDGRYKGGPIRFMNHSCDPNCRVYAVSYNKYDYRIYDLAMFACRNIEPGEELTFDYLDREDVPDEEEGEGEEEDERDGDGDAIVVDSDGESRHARRSKRSRRSDVSTVSNNTTTSQSSRKLRRKTMQNGQDGRRYGEDGDEEEDEEEEEEEEGGEAGAKRKKKTKRFDPDKKPHPRAVPCLCGASNCRRWLWT